MASPAEGPAMGPHARLIAISGPLTGEVVPITERVKIGRDSSNDICLSDLSVSRTHCTIGVGNGEWRICDAQSSNGTFVNRVQVTDRPLSDHDQIAVGESVFLFVANVYPAAIPPLVEHPLEAATRLPVDHTLYLQPGADLISASRAEAALRCLLQISTKLNRIRSEVELYEHLVELLARSVPAADQVSIVMLGTNGANRIVAASQRGSSAPIPVSDTAVNDALENKGGLLTEQGSILCVPLICGEHPLGAVHLAGHVNAFDADHLQFATAAANLAAIVLDNVRHLSWLQRERGRLQHALEDDHNLIGRSAAMRRVYAIVAKVAQSDASVLITGETGTGKELVARAIHLNGARAKRPFVAINCAALTESLLETELFGHERGAFTGAVAQKSGKLEVADGGTVFLDEVGELAPALQSKLLRALQTREFERVGGTRPVRVDIRLISATNRPLADDVAAGRFRTDLYHRLHVVDIHLPPLRERREDIPALAGNFADRFARRAARPVHGIAPDALVCLTAYDWPGNVRELENTIERAIVLGESDHIVRDDLPETLLERAAAIDIETPRFHRAVRRAKIDVIVEAFREGRRSYTEAARLLGLHPNYLHRLIRILDIKSVLESDQ
jgi:transcriptional regulator with GAF, ATPase, and Fis domain